MERMAQRMWKDLKEKLKFKGLGCCGTSWSFNVTNMMNTRATFNQEERTTHVLTDRNNDDRTQTMGEVTEEMNLASSFRSEGQFRSEGSEPVTPCRVSLMKLLQEGDDIEQNDENPDVLEKDEAGEIEGWCCICTLRRKGAAFIPCGHTVCRVCSKELWLNRGSCPLCNRSILEVLDIF